MPPDDLRRFLRKNEFGQLFRVMGWDNPERREAVAVDDSELRPVPIAEKRGVVAWRVDCHNGLPARREQNRVVRTLRRHSRDQLSVFVATDRHLWIWHEQHPNGYAFRLKRYEYPAQEPTETILQKLGRASFAIAERPTPSSSEVKARIQGAFNADKVTKSFYKEFQKHHKALAEQIDGLATEKEQMWYASVLLNRLMFIYFIQQKGFLDGNRNYLRNRLALVREHYGPDRFDSFFRQLLQPLFHEGLGSPNPTYDDPVIRQFIGTVPYVNGGIFERHALEQEYDIDIQIPDAAFESLFDFFNDWRWHLDESPTGAANEINPDILGYIFEQYINFTEKGQKQSGAYYTKPDVTGYMAASTILPALADRFAAADLDCPSVLLAGSGDDYIHDSILHGVDEPLPESPNSASTRGAAGTADASADTPLSRAPHSGRTHSAAGASDAGVDEPLPESSNTETPPRRTAFRIESRRPRNSPFLASGGATFSTAESGVRHSATSSTIQLGSGRSTTQSPTTSTCGNYWPTISPNSSAQTSVIPPSEFSAT